MGQSVAEKTCTKCGRGDVAFSADARHADGLQSQCRECFNERRRQPGFNRRYNLKSYYGLTLQGYAELLAEQNGVCAICKRPEGVVHQNGTPCNLSVDHDHSCCDGKKTCGQCIRGLLCRRCNGVIAWFEAHRESTLEYLA